MTEQCRAVRDVCPVPLVLDESIDSLAALVRAVGDRVPDAVTLKIARIGGLAVRAR